MKSSQKKFNPCIGLSFTHLIIVVLVLTALANEPHQWLALVLLASLFIWPVRFFHFHYTKRVKEMQTGG